MRDINATLKARARTHGNFEEQARTAVAIKRAVYSAPNARKLSDDQREAIDQITVKLSRLMHGDHNEPEHWHDVAGYATLVADRLLASQPPKGDVVFVPTVDEHKVDGAPDVCVTPSPSGIAQRFAPGLFTSPK